ncbi:hypothetical protein [Spirosoma sordidisoli]|uniref:XRE family transcriptional regulator n=1 Tax=Spirosoma sordidisoli TaxID=2502893 RepID=A0A4Q2US80_9BACT|nr:hypothetical protein [Spirosoma sordidisoli]RYC70721.1 hypothetical protein EQG79_00785 [Spirosoma sordidisoli]
MTEAENLKAWFTENRRKLVSVKAVEEMAGVPASTLKHFLDGRRAIPEHHLENIENVLSTIGYQSIEQRNFL